MTAQPATDPNVKIPAAVRRAAARAEKVHKAAYSPDQDPEGEGPTPDEPAPPQEDASPDTPAPEAPPPPTPTPDQTPPADAAPPSDAPPSDAPDGTPDWEHRYKSMEGRYKRAEETIQGLTGRISQLEGVIASMKQAPAAPSAPDEPEALITPEEEQDYGQEFLEVVGKKAKQVLVKELAKQTQEIADLKQKLANVHGSVEQDAQSRMLTTLDKELPNWRTVNTDPNFIAWLQLPDTYSGAIRHELLKAAYEQHQAPRVLAFFNGFLAEEAVVDPAIKGQELESAAPPPEKVPLKDLAAPGRAKSPAASSAPAEKPVITRGQITQFYADIAAGKYRGKDAEKESLEKLIFAAGRDGRIR